jgi:hypothetical protein
MAEAPRLAASRDRFRLTADARAGRVPPARRMADPGDGLSNSPQSNQLLARNFILPRPHPHDLGLDLCRSASATPARIAGEAEPVPAGLVVMQARPAGLRRKWFPSRLQTAGRACVAHKPISATGAEAEEPELRWQRTPNGARRVSFIKSHSRHTTCPGRTLKYPDRQGRSPPSSSPVAARTTEADPPHWRCFISTPP